MNIGTFMRPITHLGTSLGSLLNRATTTAYRACSPITRDSTAAWFHASAPLTSPHSLWSSPQGTGPDGDGDDDDHGNRSSWWPLIPAITGALALLSFLSACDVGSQNLPPEEEPPRDTKDEDGNSLADTALIPDTTPTSDSAEDAALADADVSTDTHPTPDTPDTKNTFDTTGDTAGDTDTAPDASETVTPGLLVWCTNDDGNECLNAAAIANAVATTLQISQYMLVHAGLMDEAAVPFSPERFFDIENAPITINVSSDAGTVPTAFAGAAHQLALTPPLFITDETDPNYWADNNAAWTGEYIWRGAQDATVSITAGHVPDAETALPTPMLHLRATHSYTANGAPQQCTAIYFSPCLAELKPIATP